MDFIYKISCDDTHEYIVGNKPLDLSAAVETAIKAMTNEEIVEPKDDWFEAIVEKVCGQTEFQRLVFNGEIDVEERYWSEVGAREDRDETEDDLDH